MKIKLSFLVVLATNLLFSSAIFAQNKYLTMDEVVLASKYGLVPAKLEQLQWIPGTNIYSWVKDTPAGGVLVSSPVSGKGTTDLVSLHQVNLALKGMSMDSLKSFPAITWINSDRFIFETSRKTFDYSVKTGKSSMIFDNPGNHIENKEINPAFDMMAFTLDNNLYLLTSSGKIAVTSDTSKGIVNGQKVHREEFGIHKGTFWSPSGKLLAFYRMDETMVTDYPIMDLTQKPAGLEMIKYPMAGGVSHEVTIGVFNPATKTTVFLNSGKPADQYLTNIAWSPDEKKILVAILNRDQNVLKMTRFDAATGALEAVLFEEKDSAYVQPLHPAIFNKDGSAFVWQSRRDGYNHLYLYDNKGKLLRQLTKGNWEVTDCIGFNSSQDKVVFISNTTNPLNREIYAVSVKNGNIQKISENGVHKATLSTAGDYFIDELSAPGIPRQISIVNGSGKKEATLLNAEDPLKSYATIQRELFTIKSENGDDLYCRLLKPANFDSTKKYPVIVYVYGGPMINLITNNWTYGADLWQHYMAQRGYVVFTLENHGTPNRGKNFEQITFRKLGEVEMQDQVAGVKFLMKQKFVDKNRMGVYGWSYGGFMSVSLMTRQPGTFKVGVAGGPVIDWSYYEVMYTERYMDTPQTNPTGYQKNSLLNYVDKLTGKMLLIHGTSDNVVVWQHTLDYLKKAVEKNVQVDYFVYPGHEHNVSGKDRIHLLNKISNYFFDNLK